MAIEVINLTKMYASQKALDHITFKTGSNHIIGFLGPNGAGKSTMMKIVTGILAADEGDIFINGLDIKKDPLLMKSKIGYLPENNPLYLDMYVREILSYEADVHAIKDKNNRINEVIHRTGLMEEQHKKVGQLSKGYKQRVGLAMAIIHNPEVLILDEPTSGLDPNQILEIRNLIKTLAMDKTVLLSTHIMQEVDAICDEVIIISKGHLKDHFLKNEQSYKYAGLTTEDIFVQLTRS